MPNNSAEHTALVNSILLALGRRPDVLIWKSQNGVFRAMEDHRRIVKTGVNGQSDISAIVAPRGRFVSIEVKTGKGVQSSAQKAWQKAVKDRGGIYCLARCVMDAEFAIEMAKLL